MCLRAARRPASARLRRAEGDSLRFSRINERSTPSAFCSGNVGFGHGGSGLSFFGCAMPDHSRSRVVRAALRARGPCGQSAAVVAAVGAIADASTAAEAELDEDQDGGGDASEKEGCVERDYHPIRGLGFEGGEDGPVGVEAGAELGLRAGDEALAHAGVAEPGVGGPEVETAFVKDDGGALGGALPAGVVAGGERVGGGAEDRRRREACDGREEKFAAGHGASLLDAALWAGGGGGQAEKGGGATRAAVGVPADVAARGADGGGDGPEAGCEQQRVDQEAGPDRAYRQADGCCDPEVAAPAVFQGSLDGAVNWEAFVGKVEAGSILTPE